MRIVHTRLRDTSILIYTGDGNVLKTPLQIHRHRSVLVLYLYQSFGRLVEHALESFCQLLRLFWGQRFYLSCLAVDLNISAGDFHGDIILAGFLSDRSAFGLLLRCTSSSQSARKHRDSTDSNRGCRHDDEEQWQAPESAG